MEHRPTPIVRGIAAVAVALAGGTVATWFAGPAEAQFVAYESRVLGIPLADQLNSPRLDAMGGLALTIPDENSELTLYDFGRNLAGLLEDKDGWSVEAHYGRLTDALDYNSSLGGAPIRQRRVVNQHAVLTEAIYRHDGKYAIGGTVQWDARDQDYRFGADALTRGPRISGYFNQVVGPVRYAVGLQRWTDNEDIDSPDLFAIRHYSAAWVVTLAGATRAAGFDLGLQGEFTSVKINGKSRDQSGFKQDEFVWNRPATQLRATAIWARPGRLQAGANLAVGSRSGNEEVKISWSDRFPGNPGRFSFARTVPTFDEEEDEFSLEARVAYRLAGSTRLGLYAGHQSFTSDVVESPNWIGSRRAQKFDTGSTRLGGGLSTALASQSLLLGAEAFAVLRTTELEQLRASSSADSRDVDLSVGAEWMARPSFAVRGGYGRHSRDEDVDRPETLNTGNGFSLGFGYLPRGGMTVWNMGVSNLKLVPDGETGSNRRNEAAQYTLATRFVF
ncbi:MAG: hypothetical protein IT349_01205 [Candidatus Eisenbacteria bacterium]|nr:hypothetical protein [Candidatus Eisenbacteria bacterium]